MGKLLNVAILIGRCIRDKQTFGIRFEEQSRGQWVTNWAFAIPEASAKKEGYDRVEIKGSFCFDDTYPGCPHCGAGGIIRCNCERVSCWDGKRKTFTCAWCGITGEVGDEIKYLNVARDR